MAFSKRELAGVLPVFQTPYHADETIDFDTLEREIAWLYDSGVNGIVMAMVSEILRLSSEEREELAAAACRLGRARGRRRRRAGVGRLLSPHYPVHSDSRHRSGCQWVCGAPHVHRVAGATSGRVWPGPCAL